MGRARSRQSSSTSVRMRVEELNRARVEHAEAIEDAIARRDQAQHQLEVKTAKLRQAVEAAQESVDQAIVDYARAISKSEAATITGLAASRISRLVADHTQPAAPVVAAPADEPASQAGPVVAPGHASVGSIPGEPVAL